jgi:iron(III) transport system permease protein
MTDRSALAAVNESGSQSAAIAPPRGRLLSPVAMLAVIVIVVLGVLVVPPVLNLIYASFTATTGMQDTGGITFENYKNLLSDTRLLEAVITSVVFAFFATAVSLLFGGAIAWLVIRTDTPFKSLAYLTTIVSMGTPYILYVSAWLFLFGRVGPFNELYRAITGSTGILFDVYSLWGMVLVEGFLWSPLVFLMLGATFRAANAEMEEAARISGGSVFDTIWRVSLQLAKPALLALAIFIFIRNLESFEVPALIGIPGRVTVLTTDIYQSIKQSPPDLGRASAFSVVMLIMVAVLLYFYSRISKSAERFASVTGKGFRPRPFRLGRWRPFAGAVILFNFVLVLGLPLIGLAWTAVMPFARPIRWSNLHLATWKQFRAVLDSPQYISLTINTLMTAAIAATAAMVIALFAGWLAARRKSGGLVADQLATLPLIFPGIVLGVAMLQISLRSPLPIYGTIWLIALAFLIRYLPYGMRYSYSGVLQIHRELEEAASVSGAGLGASLRRILAPLLSPALVAGWLFIFLISAKELSMAILLAGPNSQMMAVAMFDLWTNGQAGELSALGLMWAALMTFFAAILHLLSRRRGGVMEG